MNYYFPGYYNTELTMPLLPHTCLRCLQRQILDLLHLPTHRLVASCADQVAQGFGFSLTVHQPTGDVVGPQAALDAAAALERKAHPPAKAAAAAGAAGTAGGEAAEAGVGGPGGDAAGAVGEAGGGATAEAHSAFDDLEPLDVELGVDASGMLVQLQQGAAAAAAGAAGAGGVARRLAAKSPVRLWRRWWS